MTHIARQIMTLREGLNGFLRLPDRFFGIPEPEDHVDPDVGVLGVPYDLTSSYAPGCRFGPDAIRHATTAV
ncbi:MAG: arginase family protein, partial [Candidatus Thorarchaeota archaeon]